MASERAVRGGGRETPVSPGAYSPVRMTYGPGPANGSTPYDRLQWFDPLAPLSPIAPNTVSGRRWDFLPGYNLQIRPRAYEPVTAGMLRSLAYSYDLLRLLIETRKDQMEGLRWRFTPKDKKAKVSAQQQSKIDQLTAFWNSPDKKRPWGPWLRELLEEVLVLDAPSVFVRRTRGGDLYSLEIIDGGTIACRIDDWGRTPDAPWPAYQQVLMGFPAVDYQVHNKELWKADGPQELIYRPRNPRSFTPYGYSPVEQIIMTVIIGIRRQGWQLAFFTDGNMPQSLIGVPNEWTPDQIREFQTWFDSRLRGNSGERQGALFVPGDVAKGYVKTQEAELFGVAEEWLARVVCFAFSVPPTPFIKQNNRATAETAAEVATEEGLVPLKNWVRDFVNSVNLIEFGDLGVEFDWLEEEEVDQATNATMVEGLVKAGLKTLNEGRGMLGDDKFADPAADRLMVYTATGYAPISVDEQIADASAKQDALGPPPGALPGPEGGGRNGGGQGPNGKPPPPKSPAGGAGGEGGARAGAQDAGKIAAPPSVLDEVVTKALEALHKAAPPHNSPIPAERPLVRRRQASMKRHTAEVLAKVGDDVAAQLERKARGMGKAADDQAGLVEELLAAINLGGLEALVNVVAEDLEKVSEDSMKLALVQVGVNDPGQLVNQVHERAVAFARARAAELVGKRYDAQGNLVDSPNARMAITDATRDMLRTEIADGLAAKLSAEELAEKIQTGHAFSEARADIIARTEIARANSYGALDGYKVARDEGVAVLKSWSTMDDDDVDPEICEPNEDAGPIDLDDAFPSGDDAPPGHPNCRCGIVPVVEQGGSDAAS